MTPKETLTWMKKEYKKETKRMKELIKKQEEKVKEMNEN